MKKTQNTNAFIPFNVITKSKAIALMICAGLFLNMAAPVPLLAMQDDQGDGDGQLTAQVSSNQGSAGKGLVKEGSKLLVPAALVLALYFSYNAACNGDPEEGMKALPVCEILGNIGSPIIDGFCELLAQCIVNK